MYRRAVRLYRETWETRRGWSATPVPADHFCSGLLPSAYGRASWLKARERALRLRDKLELRLQLCIYFSPVVPFCTVYSNLSYALLVVSIILSDRLLQCYSLGLNCSYSLNAIAKQRDALLLRVCNWALFSHALENEQSRAARPRLLCLCLCSHLCSKISLLQLYFESRSIASHPLLASY